MKKITLLIVSLLLSLLFATTISFASSEPSVSIEILPDGTYYEITITENTSPIVFFSSTQTKSGSKTVAYKNTNGNTLWSVKVTGTFTYTGSSSKCTSSSVSAISYYSGWRITSKSATKSGNVATAKATAKMYENDTAVKTVTKSVTLTCSSKGVLS